jgi:hypothetical protein
MKKEYDFSKGRRGAVFPLGAGKTRITIRIDDDILLWFRNGVHQAGGGNYQTAINDALRSFIDQGSIEQTLRRVLREELRGKPAQEARRASTVAEAFDATGRTAVGGRGHALLRVLRLTRLALMRISTVPSNAAAVRIMVPTVKFCTRPDSIRATTGCETPIRFASFACEIPRLRLKFAS